MLLKILSLVAIIIANIAIISLTLLFLSIKQKPNNIWVLHNLWSTPILIRLKLIKMKLYNFIILFQYWALTLLSIQWFLEPLHTITKRVKFYHLIAFTIVIGLVCFYSLVTLLLMVIIIDYEWIHCPYSLYCLVLEEFVLTQWHWTSTQILLSLYFLLIFKLFLLIKKLVLFE